MGSLRRLPPVPHEKVWGAPLTEPWYRNPDGRDIGEVWFEASAGVPILVKLLFTREKLSVQVHPDDGYAKAHGQVRGKTEMWHVLRAEPDAEIGLGPVEPVSPQRLREAALSGDIEGMLRRVPAREGDTFFAPAGTIHVLGGGLALCEVQQRSDVTYRLFDYGRGRDLHPDQGVDVSILEPYEGRVARVDLGNGRELLAECQYFRTERLTVKGSVECPSPLKNTIYVALAGAGTIAGEAFRTGDVWEAAEGMEPFRIEGADAVFLITSEPPALS